MFAIPCCGAPLTRHLPPIDQQFRDAPDRMLQLREVTAIGVRVHTDVQWSAGILDHAHVTTGHRAGHLPRQ